MGQRFIRKIIDFTIFHNVDEIYVTIFDKHKSLINLLEKYGFKLQARKIAKTQNGHEGVYLKQFNSYYNNIDENYPLIKLNQRNFLLSIHPKWHSRLLPDSILNNEKTLDLIHDVSHTNSIDKVYLTAMQGTESLRQGDNLLIYRTSDGLGSARFRSVVSSMCVVKEVKNINEFNNYNSFKNYCSAYSVFTDQELMQFYQTKRYRVIIKFTYNFPLLKRLTRQDIIDITHYSEKQYWGFFPLSDKNIKTILKQGLVNESLIID
ncbi:hypothetical protein RHO14_08035 [Orbus wheelerorum]|uniref:hypothetical protein n=1 Tax=Orbus wheelerorum TaxID=3074111 RepID=UPI00370D2AE2